ncbi:mammalian cell entry protein, partial [Nocardia sp. NPDC004722]
VATPGQPNLPAIPGLPSIPGLPAIPGLTAPASTGEAPAAAAPAGLRGTDAIAALVGGKPNAAQVLLLTPILAGGSLVPADGGAS